MPYTVKPVDFLAQQDALRDTALADATPVVRQQWQRRQQDYLATIRAASQGQEHFKYADFVHYQANLKTLQDNYKAFDALIPPRVPGLADVAANPGAPDWQKTIAAHVATDDRAAALSDLMTNPALKWNDGLPQLADPGYAAYQKNRLAEFEATRTSTLDLLADYATIQSRLDHLDLLPNEPDQGAKTWRDLYTKWTSAKSPLLADNIITAALKPITDRVSALLALDALSDYAPLATDASSSNIPAIALTAWRKLATVPISESNPLLDDELTAQAHLKSLLASDKNLAETRTASITRELAAALPVRWNAWADTLASPDAVQHALDKAKDFNVTITPQSNPRMAYNQLFYNLRKTYDAKPAEADMKKAAQDFLDAVKNLPVANDGAVLTTIQSIKKPLDPIAQQEASAAGAGPQLVGWEMDKVRDGVRVFRHTDAATRQTFAIEFDRVDADNKQIYISSTEVPIGLFAQVLNDAKALPALDNASRPKDKQHWLTIPTGADGWKDLGPRGWQIASGLMRHNEKWLDQSVSTMGDNPFYDPKSPPPPPPPSDNSPIQNVSPYTALYFARLLGCRLPTTAEWTQAKIRFEDSAKTPNAWNLRGTSSTNTYSWVAQQNYALQLRAQGLPFPDDQSFQGDTAFSGINAENAKPWTNDLLAKIAPSRFPNDHNVYAGSVFWFRDVGHEPGFPSSLGAGYIHDLIGNVAEYVLDGPNINNVIKDARASTDDVEALISNPATTVSVIGGSALSPPGQEKLPLDKPSPINLRLDAQAYTGYADVGIRLAYTAPIQTIFEALHDVYAAPQYLKGPKALAAAR
jgi:hypothetical protein